jgi:hypothetical protein
MSCFEVEVLTGKLKRYKLPCIDQYSFLYLYLYLLYYIYLKNEVIEDH